MIQNNSRRNSQHQFKHLDQAGERMLVCPGCFKLLTRDDIEHFTACAYCNATLELDSNLEDFLLQPIINEWIMHLNPGHAMVQMDAANDFFQD